MGKFPPSPSLLSLIVFFFSSFRGGENKKEGKGREEINKIHKGIPRCRHAECRQEESVSRNEGQW